MDGNIAIIERKQMRWAHQEVLKAQKRVWQTKTRLRGGRAVRAPTLQQATLETASPMVVGPQGHRHPGQAITQKASQQWSQPARARDYGQATKFQQQAKWQSHHKSINIVGEPTFWTASPSSLGQ
jgi:hypothetical protein